MLVYFTLRVVSNPSLSPRTHYKATTHIVSLLVIRITVIFSWRIDTATFSTVVCIVNSVMKPVKNHSLIALTHLIARHTKGSVVTLDLDQINAANVYQALKAIVMLTIRIQSVNPVVS